MPPGSVDDGVRAAGHTAPVHALATRSDALTEPPSTVRQRLSGATAVHTPDERGYHFGNLLLLDGPPAPGDLGMWLTVWREQFGSVPGIVKIVLQWEADEAAPPGLAAAARDHGLELETHEVLVLADLAPGPRHPEARVLTDEDPWDSVAELIADGAEQLDFFRWRQRAHRALITAGRGEWWGIIRESRAVAAAGIFWGEGLVRFQEVTTAPDHRRMGLAGGLLRRMCDAHAHRGTVVIVAERGGDAARLYRRLGFRPAGVQQALVGPVSGP